MPTLILFGLMLVVMLMRTFLPVGAKAKGQRLWDTKLSFRERLLLQRTNIYAVGFVLLIATLFGALPQTWEILIVLAVFAVLLIPVRYVVTSEGVAMNNVVFRPWGDFTGIEVTRRRIRLVGKPGLRPFDMALLDGHQKEVSDVLRRFVAEHRLQKGGSLVRKGSPEGPVRIVTR
ncbi:MAG: hypothetical protein M1343_02165 [Chloroflexi bacterium]|nr:hypothetical protein [Chloroflexota bacterium]